MSGENLDPLLQKPLSNAFIRSCRSEKTDLNFVISFSLIGSHSPLYYTQTFQKRKCFNINYLTTISLTAMPFRGFGVSDGI